MFAWIYHGKIMNYPLWYVRSLFAVFVLHYLAELLERRLGMAGKVIVGIAAMALAYFVWTHIDEYRHYCDHSDLAASYMDVAIPISGGDNSFIIYIRDSRTTVSSLNSELLCIIVTTATSP